MTRNDDMTRHREALDALVLAVVAARNSVGPAADTVRARAEARHPELTDTFEDPEQQAVILADPEYARWLDHQGRMARLFTEVMAAVGDAPSELWPTGEDN